MLKKNKEKKIINVIHLIKQITTEITQAKNTDELELLRIKFLGKRGLINQQINILRYLSPIERPKIGKIINKTKKNIIKLLSERKHILELQIINKQLTEDYLDISLPGRRIKNGGLHPITRTITRMEDIFSNLGFSQIYGPEIEDNYHNFEALNIPYHHPSRDHNDTFWFDANRLLRTQTSGIQIRAMKKQKPPIKIISSGRVYRNDNDKNHSPMFHQMEGLLIDIHISFSNLKKILNDFLHNFFENEKLKIRFRPSYFPFTTPSAEIDIMKETDYWLEVLGCGMVHPNILRNVNIDPDKFSGFAFGIGIERLTMLRYCVTDLRKFFKNDLRFLEQFK